MPCLQIGESVSGSYSSYLIKQTGEDFTAFVPPGLDLACHLEYLTLPKFVGL